MKPKAVLATLALLACCTAAFVLWRQFSGPAVNLQPSAAVGEVLAEEVSRLTGSTGIAVLISRELPKDGPSANRERIESLEAAIKRRAQLKLAPVEWLPRPPVGTMDLGVVTPEQFSSALGRNPDAKVFVVFAGLPPYSPALAEKVTRRSAKLVAVCGYSANMRRWLESKALSVAVVPRFDDPPAGTPDPKSPKEWFDREFLLVTPDNVGQLSY